MRKEQHTDRIIRNKLKYHASATPDHLWGAIEAQLPAEKKSRRGFWWIAGGALGLALLLGMLSVFYFNNASEEYKSDTTKNNTITSVAEHEVPTIDHKDSANANDEKELASNTTKKIATDTSPANFGVAQNITKTNLITTTSKAEAEKIIKKSIYEATDLRDKVSIEVTAAETKVSEVASGINRSSEIVDFASLDVPSKQVQPLTIKEKELDWPSLFQDPKCATFGKWLKLHFYGDAYISPDVAFRELKSKEEEYEGYVSNRKATETQLLSYSMGARISVVSNYGLSLRTGLVYSQINERFDYQDENSERTIIENKYDEVTGELISSDTILESGTHFIKTYNRYRMLDVPLLLGYEVSFKKFSLSLNSGVYANLISRQKGNFLSPDLKPVTFTSDAINNYPAFRNRVSLSIYASVAMYYNLNEHWQLMIEPQMRYFLDPVTLSNYMVEQKYTTAGLITGLRYRF